MYIRRARREEMDGINRLLRQVLEIHHLGRPDLFKTNAKKYTDDELAGIIGDDSRPVFCALDEDGNVLGYAFCVFQQNRNSNILTDILTLYIDDLCVDENIRSRGVGRTLYEYVLDFARKSGCYNVTLNVWTCNPGAMRFYEKMGLRPQKTCMETIL